MVCLILGLCLSAVMIHRIDNTKVCGIRVISGDKLNDMTSGLELLKNLSDMNQLITMDGQAVPYVQTSNTFYISQPAETEEYAVTLHAVGDDYDIYLEKDELLYHKQTAISEGHTFRLWFVSDQVYFTANVIFTGLPVICIDTEAEVSEEETEGSLVIQNPDDSDINGMSVKYSAANIKENSNTGTMTLKLHKQNQEERNLSLLGIGKHSSWKLYPIYERDDTMLRSILAAYVWNVVCGEEGLQREFQYAEVIVNGTYKGLYLTSPKVGAGYLDLAPDEEVLACEQMPEDVDTDQADIRNLVNYHVYLQAVCAVRNGQTEYYLIGRNSEKEGYLYQRTPEDYKYVFGIYPKEIGWQSVTAAESIMPDDFYDKIYETMGNNLEELVEVRWSSLRENELSTKNLLTQYLVYSQELSKSGYIARNSRTDKFESEGKALSEFIIERMDYLDQYYQGEAVYE